MARKHVTDALICRAYQESAISNETTGSRLWPDDLLEQWTGEPTKVVYAALQRAEDRGLIEYGVSVRAGWLTEKGKALLGGT